MKKHLKFAIEFARILWHGWRATSTKDFYDTYSGYYDEFFGLQETYAKDTGRILEEYLNEHDITFSAALDAGCGTGVYSEVLELLCDELYGIDLSTGQLSQAQEKSLDIMLAQGNVLALPFQEGQFNLVTSLGMVRHLPEDMLGNYLGEAYRVLGSGGICLAEPVPLDLFTISNLPVGKTLKKAYNAFMRWRGLDEHLMLDPVQDIVSAMESAGFEVEQFTSKKTYTYSVILGRKPYLLR